MDNLEHSFIVELPDLNYFKAKNEDLSDEDKIIEAIRKSPNIKQSKLAEIIGKSIRTVARVIKNSPRIRRVGSNRTGNWEIVGENKQSES